MVHVLIAYTAILQLTFKRQRTLPSLPCQNCELCNADHDLASVLFQEPIAECSVEDNLALNKVYGLRATLPVKLLLLNVGHKNLYSSLSHSI